MTPQWHLSCFPEPTCPTDPLLLIYSQPLSLTPSLGLLSAFWSTLYTHEPPLQSLLVSVDPKSALVSAFSSSLSSSISYLQPHPPARLAVLIRRDDSDVDLVRSAEQPGPLLRAQVNKRVSAQPHYTSPQLQASTLGVTEPLQLRHKALLVHEEAGLPDSISQGGDL